MARNTGWVPNQHGAWAMLAAPLAVGIAASRPSWVHLPLTLFWFVGFFAFFATTLWLKSRRKSKYLAPMVTWGALAAVCGLLVAWMNPGLVTWAPLFVLPLGVGLVASARRDERSLVNGVATTVGSSLMTVVAYDAGGGPSMGRAWLMALVLALYFVGTVVYVKTVIRERNSRGWRWASVVFHGLCAVALWALSPWLTAVFALLTLRAALVPGLHATPKQVGVPEFAGTALVAVAAVLAIA